MPTHVNRMIPGIKKSANGLCSSSCWGKCRSWPVGSVIRLHPPKRAPVPLKSKRRMARMRRVFMEYKGRIVFIVDHGNENSGKMCISN